jgi:hypothetical protein
VCVDSIQQINSAPPQTNTHNTHPQQAIGDVFGDSHDLQTNPLRIASVKSNVGHGEIVAGLMGLVKVRFCFVWRLGVFGLQRVCIYLLTPLLLIPNQSPNNQPNRSSR